MGGSLADYTQQANLKDSMAEMKSKHEVVLQLRETDKLWKKKKWEQMHPEAAEKKHKDEKRKDMKLHKKQEVREKQASKYEDLLTVSYHHEKQQTQKPYKHMKRVKMLQSPVIPVSKEDKDVLNNLMKASETAHTEQASQTKQDRKKFNINRIRSKYNRRKVTKELKSVHRDEASSKEAGDESVNMAKAQVHQEKMAKDKKKAKHEIK